jgi:hypothetical protein
MNCNGASNSSDILCHAGFYAINLPLARLSPQMFDDFHDLRNAGGTYRMATRL